jgi:hypothetical protein
MAHAAPEPKITMCHLPPGNPENIQTISIGESAIQAHLDHGDGIGDCENDFALITVTKNVVNDNDGDKNPSDFTMIVSNSDNEIVTFPGSSSGTTILIPDGDYSVSEIADAEYSSFSSDACTGTAQLLDVIRCTITNDDIDLTSSASLTVIKTVINDDGGNKTASDFTMLVDATNPSQSIFAGSKGTVVSIDPGDYSVSEIADAEYSSSSSSDCIGDATTGEFLTCTITNDDKSTPPSGKAFLTVIKNVINDDAGTQSASKTNPTKNNFPGDENGTKLIIDAGLYNVTETGPSGYDASFSQCTGTASSGNDLTCTITNDQLHHHSN